MYWSHCSVVDWALGSRQGKPASYEPGKFLLSRENEPFFFFSACVFLQSYTKE